MLLRAEIRALYYLTSRIIGNTFAAHIKDPEEKSTNSVQKQFVPKRRLSFREIDHRSYQRPDKRRRKKRENRVSPA